MIEPTKYRQIPNYLKAVTIMEPEGNIAAEVAAELERWTSHAQQIFVQRSASTRPEGEIGKSKPISGKSSSKRLVRRIAASIVGAFGALMLFLSVVDAGVAGISEGGLLIGAICLGLTYALWLRD